MAGNNLQQVKKETRLATSHNIINAIEKFSQARALDLDDYQKICGINALNYIATLVDDMSTDLDRNNVTSVVQDIMFLRLNVANGEIAIIKRYNKGGKDKVEFQVMGHGNDTLLRDFGVNVKKVHQAWLVRENDIYEPQQFVGIKKTDPVWKIVSDTKIKRGKLVRVVYPVELHDGEVIYLEGEREDVKISLIAQAKQNMMKAKDKKKAEELLREMETVDLDTLIENPEWRDKEIEVLQWDNKNNKWGTGSTKIFNDTYTGFSRENMIERKMRNHAIRKYPKKLDNQFVREAHERTFEEERHDKQYVIEQEEDTKQVELAREQITNAGSVEVQDNIQENIQEDTIPNVIEDLDKPSEQKKPTQVKVKKETVEPIVEQPKNQQEKTNVEDIDDDLDGMFD